ncbi:neuronal acetylcholine receptor subunit alpha-3-like [Mizuhopecten yessoensis]|uniref:neuronal acetylcholine receptor subunit alpha-3-like n=1 Tax=Mizuhopecten yessoensis TaxID=6573 RepID=UPI000B45EE94|nr:neuronal acetylcholine receptor subunit alpha-3-like [Mizuhopecten yessoensis]XP_021358061.1 neuronal acetylcholine receptor subunit alpha-3-like [Mizuhopecten yessoensis]
MESRLLILVVLLLRVSIVDGWSSTDELTLRNLMFATATYHRLIRPADVMTAKVGISLISINDLSMVDQSMSVTGWLTVEWEDTRLTWTAASYSNVDHFYAIDKEIWKPELFIDNSVDDVSILQDDNLLFRVADTGKVDWEMPQIFVTSCTIDTTYYPFDTQECAIDVTSWAYTKEELELTHLRDKVNVEDLGENGEWTYTNSRIETSSIVETTANGIVETFSLLKFVVVLTRRHDFYLTNVILPVVLSSFLVVLVFVLPVDSGEKVSYALTVLLALAVLLTLIADSMPNTSLNVSILSVYLAFTLIMAVLAVGLSVLVLRMHHTDPAEPVPAWLQSMTGGLFARFGCWRGCCCCPKDNRVEVINKRSDGADTAQNEAGQNTETLPSYSWTEVSAIFDWFLFVWFFVVTSVTAVLFLILLRVGGSIKAANAS